MVLKNKKLATADLWLDGSYNEEFNVRAVEALLGKYTKQHHIAHSFGNLGIMAIWTLDFGYFIMHTYPERKFVAVEFYSATCDIDPIEKLVELSNTLCCKQSQFSGYGRGVKRT